ncbi:hypothetical protein M422DRAFT_261492 [Sphaerobolus stellatus SS14]|uniref:Nephrocystin 3-like N-terminal domain-containing protein n=1 Tax=Sphaerobolus stellatus (strain SS14) TaxID=990650 RepID=A0A0C9VEV2_SPHS4|nr:hypothetical protein M422DRAFT_261492 [Sphaerobolus stellatus SS14]
MDSTKSIETLNRLSQHVEIKGIRIISHNDIKLSSTLEFRIDELSKDTKTNEAVQGTSGYWSFNPPLLVLRSQSFSVTPQASKKKYLFNRPKFDKHTVDSSALLNAAILKENYKANVGQKYSLEVDAELGVLRPEDLLQFDLDTCVDNMFEGISGLRTFLKALDDNSDVLDTCASFVSDFSKAPSILVVSIPYTMLKNFREYKEKMTSFIKEFQKLLPLLSDISQLSEKARLQDPLKDIFETIVNILQLIGNYLRQHQTGQLLDAQFKHKSLDDYYKDLQKRIQDVKDGLQVHIADVLKKLESSDRLKSLIKGIEEDNLPNDCLTGTRQHIFDIVDNWCHDKKSKPNLLWISGSPGAGKSAIASSLVSQIGRENCARFFFKRDSAYFRDPSNVWKTIAYHLAIVNKDIGIYLDKYLETNPSYMDNSQRSEDFKTLIVETFKYIPSENHSKAPIIIIDALDECDTSEGQKIFYKSLADWAEQPEFNFKMIVTSRNQDNIWKAIGKCCHHLLLHTGQKLSQYAAGLFIWAKLVTSYIAAGIATEHLEDILTNMGQLGHSEDNNLNLDRLYAQILYSIFQGCTKKEKNLYELVLGALIYAKSPLSINILEIIFKESKITSEAISTALRKFSPLLLSLDLDDRDAPLHLCHLSFRDFFQENTQEETGQYENITRSHKALETYSKSLQQSSQMDICNITSTESLGYICLGLLKYMNNELQFNMGQLESSHFANKDITGLSQRLDSLISKPLRFSCQWWHEHLPENVDTSSNGELLKEAEIFLKNKLLFWLEVMSLMEQIPGAVDAMQYAKDIFKARFDMILNVSVSQIKFII